MSTASSGRMPRREQLGDVRQEDRHVVGPALVDGLARVGADEERAVAEAAGHLRRQVRRRALGVDVDDADVAQLAGAARQRLEQDRWRGRAAVDEHLLAGRDAGDGLSAVTMRMRSVWRGRRVAASCHRSLGIGPIGTP